MKKYIDYDELMDSDWPICGDGNCRKCQHYKVEVDNGCKVIDWINSLPKYEMRPVMERIETEKG